MSLSATPIPPAPRASGDSYTVADLIEARPAWMRRAACAGHPQPERWFPEGTGAGPAAALTICEGCLVRPECLAYAIGRPDLVGVWGGTTDRDRRAMRRT